MKVTGCVGVGGIEIAEWEFMVATPRLGFLSLFNLDPQSPALRAPFASSSVVSI